MPIKCNSWNKNRDTEWSNLCKWTKLNVLSRKTANKQNRKWERVQITGKQKNKWEKITTVTAHTECFKQKGIRRNPQVQQLGEKVSPIGKALCTLLEKCCHISVNLTITEADINETNHTEISTERWLCTVTMKDRETSAEVRSRNQCRTKKSAGCWKHCQRDNTYMEACIVWDCGVNGGGTVGCIEMHRINAAQGRTNK